MQYNRNRLALASLALAVTLPDASAFAATCRSKMDDYNSEATQQVAKAKQLGPTVFTPLQQKKCTPGAQAFLDSYISLLKRLVALRADAYPCNDTTGRNQPIPGTPPDKILGEAQDLRVLCQAYLNAPPKEAERRPPDGGGDGSCSDITGLGGPRIKCPERKPGNVPGDAQLTQRPQTPQVRRGSSDAKQEQAINDVIRQLSGAPSGSGPASSSPPTSPPAASRRPPLPPASPLPTSASQVPACLGQRYIDMDGVPGHGEPHMATETRLRDFASNGEWNVGVAASALRGVINIPGNPDEPATICNLGTAGCNPDCSALSRAYDQFRYAQANFAKASGRNVKDDGSIDPYSGDSEFRNNICTQWDARRAIQAAKAASALRPHLCNAAPSVSNVCLARTPAQEEMLAEANNLFEGAHNIDVMRGGPNHYQEVGMTRCQAMAGAIQLYDDAVYTYGRAARTYASGICVEDQNRIAEAQRLRTALEQRRKKQCDDPTCTIEDRKLKDFNDQVVWIRSRGGDASGVCSAIAAANCSVTACSQP